MRTIYPSKELIEKYGKANLTSKVKRARKAAMLAMLFVFVADFVLPGSTGFATEDIMQTRLATGDADSMAVDYLGEPVPLDENGEPYLQDGAVTLSEGDIQAALINEPVVDDAVIEEQPAAVQPAPTQPVPAQPAPKVEGSQPSEVPAVSAPKEDAVTEPAPETQVEEPRAPNESVPAVNTGEQPAAIQGASAEGFRDRDANAVIYAGAYEKTELVRKIVNGDGQHTDIKRKFNNIGIYEEDIYSGRTVNGYVTKQGEVWVNGRRVATSVFSAGRSYMEPSTSWDGLYWRRPAVSFNSNSLSAFVYMSPGGRFTYAILKSCGNPIMPSLQPIRPRLQVSKKVHKLSDADNWFEERDVDQGENFMWMLYVKNLGPVTTHDVRVRDRGPAEVDPVFTSFYMFGAIRRDFTEQEARDFYSSDGHLTFARLGPNQYGNIRYRVIMDPNAEEDCYVNSLDARTSERPSWITDTARVCIDIEEQAPQLILSKSAFNNTQDVDATTTLAHAGDSITYSLNTREINGEVFPNYTVSDDVSDILEYANITDTGGGNLAGGTISYPAQDIPASGQVTENFTVVVRPFDQWPQNGDLTLVNFYGNEVRIRLGYWRLSLAKSAFNNTQNVDATTVVADPGDVITYTLATHNSGNEVAPQYITRDDLADVLEYADVTDPGTGILTGSEIVWDARDIAAGETYTVNFEVTVKDPLPGDPQDGTHFDFLMDNVYGNMVRIRLIPPPPPIIPPGVVAGAAVSKLVAAGSNPMFIALLLIVLASTMYLYVKEHLTLKEAYRRITL